MSVLEKTATKNLYIHIGAPDPIIFRYRAGGTGGTLVAFDSSLKFQFVTPSGTTVLGVGSGITLSTDETVANARATIQLTVAQSRAIPSGGLTTYEIQRTVGGRDEVILMGTLIGIGGDNPDGN